MFIQTFLRFILIIIFLFQYGRISIETASKANHELPNSKSNVDKKQDVEIIDDAESKETSNGTLLITRDAVLLPQHQENATEKPNIQKKVSINDKGVNKLSNLCRFTLFAG